VLIPQFLHVVFPSLFWNFPTSHVEHEVAPSRLEYRPALQGVQLVAPLVLPARAESQSSPPRFELVPAVHLMHMLLVNCDGGCSFLSTTSPTIKALANPDAHFTHATPLDCIPGKQPMHTLRVGSGWVPTPQDIGEVSFLLGQIPVVHVLHDVFPCSF
jgi:hypothetical protein